MVGDGFRVHNFFPSDTDIGITGMSPFFLLDYASKYYFPPSDKQRGVDVHPHRGFEAVTISFHGSIAHHDNAGNSGVIRDGDVQWMTAASGVLHKEYHEEEFSKKGGIFQMAQIWVNLPSRFKMIPPRYQAITKDEIVRHLLDDKVSTVSVIAGEYRSTTGPASTFTPISLFTVDLKAGGNAAFRFPETYNAGILVVEGEVSINNKAVPENHFAWFDHNGTDFEIKGIKDSVVLILAGEPIDEPVASRGPFVMNTMEEINKAYDDLRSGKFGTLVS